MSVLDVNVKADHVSCRELADWIGHLQQAVKNTAAAVSKTGSTAQSFWEGVASDAFVTQMTRRTRDIDDLGDAIARAHSGLVQFADDIDTIRRRMNDLLQEAHEEGLTVTGTLIHRPPGNALDMMPQGAGGSMPGLETKSMDHKRAQHKLEEFGQLSTRLDELRRYERTAHRSLAQALENTNTVISAVSDPNTWIGRSLVFATTAHGASKKFSEHAIEMSKFVQNSAVWSSDGTVPAAVREQRIHGMLSNMGMSQQASDSNAKLLLNVGKTRAGDFVLKRLSGSVGGKSNTRVNAVGRAFSWSAVGVAAATTGIDIKQGKPILKSVWTNFSSLGVSTAASSATETGMMAAGASGGPVTAAGLGVGFAAATGWSYFQDNDLQDAYRDLGGGDIDTPDNHSNAQRKARFGW